MLTILGKGCKLCVNGQEIRHAKKILPDPFSRPFPEIESALMERFMENSTPSIRYYECIQVTSWRGEIILSIFIRFFKTGQNLFVEASYFVLPPLRRSYYQVDAIRPHPTFQQVFGFLYQTLFSTFLFFPFSWFVAGSRLLNPVLSWLRNRSRRREIRENLVFDYGAATSIRAYAADSNYHQYFQKLDKEMYVKIIERHILDTITDFLDAKNIDTSDLKERQSTILNNGVIVSGGSIQAQSFAVGEWAKSIVNQFSGGSTAPDRKTQRGSN